MADYEVNGSLTEALPITDWIAHCCELETGSFLGTVAFTGSSYTVSAGTFGGAVLVTVLPDMGSLWAPSTAVVLGEKSYPISSATESRYFECTTAGTTGASEPTWPTSGTVNDGTAVWTFVSNLVRPKTHGPLTPTLV